VQRAMRMTVVTAACLVGTGAALPATAGAQQPAPAGTTVTSVGSAQVKPVPGDRHSDASIRQAVADAETKALPRALARAQVHAGALATAAGMKLGGLLSIADTPQPGYPFVYSPQNGTFGTGHFCGQVRGVRIVRRKNGTPQRIMGRRHRVCRVPSTVAVSVTLTYAVAPA